jgi:hypothetical protein
LVRKRLDDRGMHGQNGVEKMCKTNTMGFGYQPKLRPVAVKTPRSPQLDQFEARLIMAVEKHIGDFTVGSLAGEFNGGGAKPLRVNNGNQGVGKDTPDASVWSQIL